MTWGGNSQPNKAQSQVKRRFNRRHTLFERLTLKRSCIKIEVYLDWILKEEEKKIRESKHNCFGIIDVGSLTNLINKLERRGSWVNQFVIWVLSRFISYRIEECLKFNFKGDFNGNNCQSLQVLSKWILNLSNLHNLFIRSASAIDRRGKLLSIVRQMHRLWVSLICKLNNRSSFCSELSILTSQANRNKVLAIAHD